MTKKQIESLVNPESDGVASAARERILDAADRLLARYGYRKMTVEDIAHEAGIGKGSVYLWFPSKEEVALSCIDRMVDGLLERLRAIAAEGRPAAERIRAMLGERVLHRFDYAQAHAASIDAMLERVRPALLARRVRHFAAEAEVLAALLRAAAASGAIASADPARDAEALVVATNALLPYSLGPHELGDRAELERRVAALADLLVRGLVLHPAGRAARSEARRSSA